MTLESDKNCHVKMYDYICIKFRQIIVLQLTQLLLVNCFRGQGLGWPFIGALQVLHVGALLPNDITGELRTQGVYNVSLAEFAGNIF